MKTNIKIESIFGRLLFEHQSEDNSIKETIEKANLIDADLTDANLINADLTDAHLTDANLRGADLTDANLISADLRGSDLRGADLRGSDLRGADLTDANLRGADLRGSNLRGANLRGSDLRGADLRGSDLRGADLTDANLRGANLRDAEGLPEELVNECLQQIYFIACHQINEVPYLIKKLKEGEVDGKTYEGDCCCFVGSLAKGENVDKYCSMIPYYQKGTHNPAENWFLNIRKGDTPENSFFARKALEALELALLHNK